VNGTKKIPKTTFEQGDIVEIFGPFVKQPKPGETPKDPKAYVRNGLWGKDRPMVVVSAGKHNRKEDLLVASISGRVGKAQYRGDYVLRRWREAGLREPSAVRPRLFQIIKDDILNDDVGRIHDDDWAGIQMMLRDLMAL